ncbi:Protein of unknown function DUF1676 [Cinara cedri]|uniref:Uncharacterized protein n=1 Tax=Cinara cedri TaxID=506608 RepID=A0A5E4MI28_9HEMI|nr:Protein of unknown function DUF1676 [Cinara cedri]
MFLRLKDPVLLHQFTLALFALQMTFQGSQSFVFDQCTRRHTNLTAQECVGKLLLDTLTKATEDPENFIKANGLDNEGGGTMRLIELKFDNSTVQIDQRYKIDESRSSNSFWDQLVNGFKKLTNYGTDHGILVTLPQQGSKSFPPISVIEEDQVFQVVNEMFYIIAGRARKHPTKKFALLFPLLATFKFLIIKALLVPILIAVLIIKKILVLGVMALPAVLTMLRFCRRGDFGFGNLVAAGPVGPVGQAAAFAPLTADISGDYSSYVQQSAGSSQMQNNAYRDYSKNLMDAMKGAYRR